MHIFIREPGLYIYSLGSPDNHIFIREPGLYIDFIGSPD